MSSVKTSILDEDGRRLLARYLPPNYKTAARLETSEAIDHDHVEIDLGRGGGPSAFQDVTFLPLHLKHVGLYEDNYIMRLRMREEMKGELFSSVKSRKTFAILTWWIDRVDSLSVLTVSVCEMFCEAARPERIWKSFRRTPFSNVGVNAFERLFRCIHRGERVEEEYFRSLIHLVVTTSFESNPSLLDDLITASVSSSQPTCNRMLLTSLSTLTSEELFQRVVAHASRHTLTRYTREMEKLGRDETSDRKSRDRTLVVASFFVSRFGVPRGVPVKPQRVCHVWKGWRQVKARYCSRECQMAHWKEHKRGCRSHEEN
ncbi:hypothetical protein PROFUN_07156 [Planoprotostelium fungivorum]|uniref:MYND-type domain-containing protein n=1 Tax=Planoprotostelium fungivorum TaxID=1890364 RepID=A0A2P6NMP6_9EUKA|nr:hypothetical protein PROFUN_07156 [Planoprotostelium fungivorum]